MFGLVTHARDLPSKGKRLQEAGEAMRKRRCDKSREIGPEIQTEPQGRGHTQDGGGGLGKHLSSSAHNDVSSALIRNRDKTKRKSEQVYYYRILVDVKY